MSNQVLSSYYNNSNIYHHYLGPSKENPGDQINDPMETTATIDTLEPETNNTRRPTAISLAAGVGITDRCLFESGFQVILANDISYEAQSIYSYNHSYKNPAYNPTFIKADLTLDSTIHKIIAVATSKLLGQNLDLLTALCLPGKDKLFDKYLSNHFFICEKLSPKIFVIDQIKNTAKKIHNFFQKYILENPSFDYQIFTKQYFLKEHRVPNSSSRSITYLINKTYLKSKDMPSFDLRKYSEISIREALKPVWQDTDNTNSNTTIPLHINPIKMDEKDSNKLNAMLDKIPQGQFLDKALLKDNLNKSYRFHENACFGFTISARAFIGPFWSIHPKYNRGYTPFELIVLSTISQIPFELNPNNNHRMSSHIFSIIANTTAPKFLLQIFDRCFDFVSPSAKQDPPLLKHTFSSIQCEGKTVYTSSHYAVKPSVRHLNTLLADNSTSTFFSYNYRVYLYDLIHQKIDTIIQLYPKSTALKNYKSAMQFKIYKQKDKEQKTVDSYYKNTKSLLNVLDKLLLLNESEVYSKDFTEKFNINFIEGLKYNDSKIVKFINFALKLNKSYFDQLDEFISVYLPQDITIAISEVKSFEEWKKTEAKNDSTPEERNESTPLVAQENPSQMSLIVSEPEATSFTELSLENTSSVELSPINSMPIEVMALANPKVSSPITEIIERQSQEDNSFIPEKPNKKRLRSKRSDHLSADEDRYSKKGKFSNTKVNNNITPVMITPVVPLAVYPSAIPFHPQLQTPDFMAKKPRDNYLPRVDIGSNTSSAFSKV